MFYRIVVVLSALLLGSAATARNQPSSTKSELTCEEMENFLREARIGRQRETPKGVTHPKHATLDDGLDAEGRDTTDPKKIATLTPLGGPKGSGLSLMIEYLASLTVGSPLISLALAGGLAEDPFLHGVAIAVDLAAIGDLDTFTTEVDRLGDAITALPRAAGVDRILLPGERGDAILAEREASGIPVPAGTWKRLVAAAKELGVAAP